MPRGLKVYIVSQMKKHQVEVKEKYMDADAREKFLKAKHVEIDKFIILQKLFKCYLNTYNHRSQWR